MLDNVSRFPGSFSRLTSSRSSRSRFSLLSSRNSRTISSLIPSSLTCSASGRAAAFSIPSPLLFRFFFLCAHTIPSANAPAPTFTVHPAFQHDSFHQPSVPASSNSLPSPLSPHPFSFLQSSLVSAYLPPSRLQPFLQPLFLSLFNSAALLHSGTPSYHFFN